MPGYLSPNGTAQKIKKNYVGVDDVAKKVKRIYAGRDGIAHIVWKDATEFKYHSTINGNTASGKYRSATVIGDYVLVHTDTSSVYPIDKNLVVNGDVADLDASHEFSGAASTPDYAIFVGGKLADTGNAYDKNLTRNTFTTNFRNTQTATPSGASFNGCAYFVAQSYTTASTSVYSTQTTTFYVDNQLTQNVLTTKYLSDYNTDPHGNGACSVKNYVFLKTYRTVILRYDANNICTEVDGADAEYTSGTAHFEASTKDYAIFAMANSTAKNDLIAISGENGEKTTLLTGKTILATIRGMSLGTDDRVVFAPGDNIGPASFDTIFLIVSNELVTNTTTAVQNRSEYGAGVNFKGKYGFFIHGTQSKLVDVYTIN